MKVFIHETFHNFGLDFSDANNNVCKKILSNIFDVESKFNLYEAYTEFWAEIVNSLFCSFNTLENKNDKEKFLSYAVQFIELERSYSFFQMVKILNFMGLSYRDLYSNTNKSSILRKTMYKEDTNVLAYFIVKTILMCDYEAFLEWCLTNNYSLIKFYDTEKNQEKFCDFIINHYKTKKMIKMVNNMEKLINTLNNKKKHSKFVDFLLTNMRMTISELG